MTTSTFFKGRGARSASPRHGAKKRWPEGRLITQQENAMSTFTDSELDYLLTEFDHLVTKRRLARLATVGKDGTPHVVPVGWSYNAEHDTIDVGGFDNERTKKFRDVARSGRAAIVVDDVASTDPWRPRGIEVRGRAEAIHDGRPLIRIHPERIVSWGIEGDELHSRPRRSDR
jgi:pyridoxamine 5'-phosphate oxidase family protein